MNYKRSNYAFTNDVGVMIKYTNNRIDTNLSITP